MMKMLLIYLFFIRCDNSGSDVNLEKCLEEYMTSTIGCHFPLNLYIEDSQHPICNLSNYRDYLKTYATIIEGGEAEIHKITGCMPR